MFVGEKQIAWRILEAYDETIDAHTDGMVTSVSKRPTMFEIFTSLVKPLVKRRVLSLVVVFFLSSISFNSRGNLFYLIKMF